MVRALRPRPAVTVAPLAISTETCLQLGGLTDRKLRDLLVRYPDVPRSRVGHTLLLTPEAFAELLRRTRVAADGESIDVTSDDDSDQPETVGAVLAALGKEVA